MTDVKFIDGLIIKPPVKKDGSPLPEFIKAKGSIKRQELIDWLTAMEGDWINFDVKESRQGKWYAAIDDWKPDGEYAPAAPAPAKPKAHEDGAGFPDDTIPF